MGGILGGPLLLQRSTTVHIVLRIALGVVLVRALKAGIAVAITPNFGANSAEAMSEVTFHGACANPGYKRTCATQAPLSFGGWPLVREKGQAHRPPLVRVPDMAPAARNRSRRFAGMPRLHRKARCRNAERAAQGSPP